MQALERTLTTNDWITYTLLFLLGLVFVLRGLNQAKLQGYFLTFFNKGFINDEMEDRLTIFNSFYILQFLFAAFVIAMALFTVVKEVSNHPYEFSHFIGISAVVTSYFLFKRGLEFGIAYLLKIQDGVQYYLLSKDTYLYTTSYYIFAMVVIYTYAGIKLQVLLIGLLFVFLIRLALIVSYNKNLIPA